MPNKTRGVGLFTVENIVAVIRAIPESDGTYRDVARKAEQYGSTVHYHTISNWVRHGRLIWKLANRQPPMPDSPNGTESWSTSTADRTTTGTANSNGHSRSSNGPASVATTRC